MKRQSCFIAALMCLAVGVLRYFDIVKFTDEATGFTTQGSVWIRFTLLVAPFIFILLSSAAISVKHTGTVIKKSLAMSLAMIICAFSALAATVFSAIDAINSKGLSSAEMLLGILLIIYAMWCFVLAAAFGTGARRRCLKGVWLGIIGVMPVYFSTVMRFITKPSSLYRIEKLVNIFSALAALVFLTMLLRGVYTYLTTRQARKLYISGMLAFLICFCTAGAGVVHRIAILKFDNAEMAIDILIMGIGLIGLLTSFSLAKSSETKFVPADY